MFSLFFLILGGAAVASVFTHDHKSPDDEEDNPHNRDDGERDMAETISPFDTDHLQHSDSKSEQKATDNIEKVDEDLRDENLSQKDDLELNNHEDVSNDRINLSEENITHYPNALSDWTSTDKVNILKLGQKDTLTIKAHENDRGSLVVIDADYSESSADEGERTAIEYTGSNVYYIPEGSHFPKNYQWSTEGGTLYNVKTFENHVDDFRNIKLKARIDSGGWAPHLDGEGDGETLFDTRIGDPSIISNLKISRM